MAGKISEYTTEQTTLADTDRLDVSTGIGGTPVTEYLSWGSLKTQLGTAGFLSSGDVDLGYTASTRTVTNTGGDDVVLPLFTSTEAGLAPLSGGGTTNFLRADGTWAAAGGADGNGIYTGTGSLSGATTVIMGGNLLSFTGGNLSIDGSTFFVDYTNNKVGIGTSSPDSDVRLTIKGGTLADSSIKVDCSASTQASGMVFNNNLGKRFALYLGGTSFNSTWGDIGDTLSVFDLVTTKPITTWVHTSGRFGINIADKDNILTTLHVGGDTRIDGECRATTYNVNGTAGLSHVEVINAKTFTWVSGILTSVV